MIGFANFKKPQKKQYFYFIFFNFLKNLKEIQGFIFLQSLKSQKKKELNFFGKL